MSFNFLLLLSLPALVSGAMENIGFVESNDPDKAQMVKGILTTVRKNKEVENMSESTEANSETLRLLKRPWKRSWKQLKK